MAAPITRLRSFALAFEGAFEDHPFGPEPVFKAANKKIFVFTGSSTTEQVTIGLKLTPDEASEALTLPFVSVAPYVGRYGWVSVRLATPVEWEIAEGWIRRSYELVTGAKAKRARR